jgi:hypothetical protein
MCHGTIGSFGLPLVTSVPKDGSGDFLKDMWVGRPDPIESWIFTGIDFDDRFGVGWVPFDELRRHFANGGYEIPDSAAKKYRWQCDRCATGTVEATTTTIQTLLWNFSDTYDRTNTSTEMNVPIDVFRRLITKP